MLQRSQNRVGRIVVRGFTIIELMVTVAVIAILAAVAIPSFESIINGNRITSQANELVGVMQRARSEAIRFNQRVYICSSSNGTSCAASSRWSGWLVFRDDNGDAQPAAAEIMSQGLVKDPVVVTSALNPGVLHFRSDGLARGTGNGLLATSFTVCIATTRPAQNIRGIAMASGSRMNITRSSGTCQ